MNAYTTNRHLSPLLVLFLGILVVSTASVFIRFAQQDAPSIVIAAYRLSIATLILLPGAFAWRRDEMLHLGRKQLALILLSGLFLAVHFAAWISSLEYTTVASSVVLVSTTPLWVAILSPLFIREKPNRWLAAGMIVALAGGVVVGLSESCDLTGSGLRCPPWGVFFQGSAFWGDALAIIGAMAAAVYILVGRWLRPTLSLLVYITTVYGVAALVLAGVSISSGQPVTGFRPSVYLFLIALAVGPQLLGHTSFNYSLRYLSAAYVSVALLGEPIGSTILALLILRETPSPLEVIGGGVILLGIYLATRGQQNALPSKLASSEAPTS